MKSPKTRQPLFERLKAGLEEGIRHARGEIELRTTTLEQPDRPPAVGASELAGLRLASGMTRDGFARLLNVSPRTVQDWERGRRRPSHAALRLIQVFRRDPAILLATAGMTGTAAGARGERPASAGRRKAERNLSVTTKG